MTRALVTQKLLAVAIVAMAVLVFNPLQVALAFSVLGQGHFLGAYYYQWKAGKTRAIWIAVYFAIAAALFAIALSTRRYEWFALGASILFFAHHFHDEVTLFGKERSAYRLFELLPPFILYSAFVSDILIGTSLSLPGSFAVAGIGLAYFVFLLRARRMPDSLSIYLWAVTLGLLSIKWVFTLSIAPETLIGSVILFHYVCWYVYFYFRFAQDPARQRGYIRDMLCVHAIVGAAYVLWAYTPARAALDFLFVPVFFYIWAIMHIVFSVRASDVRALLKW